MKPLVDLEKNLILALNMYEVIKVNIFFLFYDKCIHIKLAQQK